MQNLDLIAVSAMASELGDVITAHIDIPLKYEELKSPQVVAVFVLPILEKIKKQTNKAVFYALLANKIHFSKTAKNDVASAKLWRSRERICELLAIKLLKEFSAKDLGHALTFGFYPLATGEPLLSVPEGLRVSALELALLADAKQLLSHPAVVALVNELWNGTVVCGRFAPVYYNPEGPLLKAERLRVPAYRHAFKVMAMMVLVALYMGALSGSSLYFSFHEVVFFGWAFTFVVQEVHTLTRVGLRLYFGTLWSILDLCSAFLLVAHWVLRSIAVAKLSQRTNALASDVLSLCGVFLIPRLFCVLEASDGFASLVISIRKMCIDLVYCCLAALVFGLGFYASLTRFAKGLYQPETVFYHMFQIMFSFTPAVWLTWQSYSPLGALVLFLYLFMVQFVVSTIVIAALSARYSEIKEHASQEFHHLRTLNLISNLKSAPEYVFLEPFNVLGLVLSPLKHVLSSTGFDALNKVVLFATHFPALILIRIYEDVVYRLSRRKIDQEEEQSERIRRHLLTNRPLAPRDRKNRMSRSKYMLQGSKLDLVDEAIKQTDATLRESQRQASPYSTMRRDDERHSRIAPSRARAFSTASSLMEQYQSFKLSPSKSYGSLLHRVHPDRGEDRVEDRVPGEPLAEESDLIAWMEEMDRSHQRIESVLEHLCAQLERRA